MIGLPMNVDVNVDGGEQAGHDETAVPAVASFARAAVRLGGRTIWEDVSLDIYAGE